MVEAWRIVKKKYAGGAFDGEGARLNGGRWTSAGRRAVYSASSISLATLEMLVHLGSQSPLADYVLIEVTIPEDLVEALSAPLPAGWRAYPAPPALAALGDAWLASGRSAVLAVPSALVPSEAIYVLNPVHPHFAEIRISRARAHAFDPRLMGR